jgi:hypothetical protein
MEALWPGEPRPGNHESLPIESRDHTPCASAVDSGSPVDAIVRSTCRGSTDVLRQSVGASARGAWRASSRAATKRLRCSRPGSGGFPMEGCPCLVDSMNGDHCEQALTFNQRTSVRHDAQAQARLSHRGRQLQASLPATRPIGHRAAAQDACASLPPHRTRRSRGWIAHNGFKRPTTYSRSGSQKPRIRREIIEGGERCLCLGRQDTPRDRSWRAWIGPGRLAWVPAEDTPKPRQTARAHQGEPAVWRALPNKRLRCTAVAEFATAHACHIRPRSDPISTRLAMARRILSRHGHIRH